MPDILPASEWPTYIDPAVVDNVSDWHVDRAERTVIDRYREDPGGPSEDVFDIVDGAPAPVQLDGWKEAADGTPDTDAMPDRLVDALRDTISRLVEHRLTAPERGIAMQVRGSRRESYASRASGVPPRTYAALRPFDDRTPWL
jgi:hypothetical protein